MKFSKFSELVNRILSNNHSHRRDMDVTIVVHSPGSIGSTPSVEVQSIHAGFDWDSGKVLIFPAQPLTTLTPEQITDITDSVRKGQSWHAYQEYKKHKEQLEKLSIELDTAKQRIAELEGNRAALAAENARLKAICEDRRTFIMNGVQLGFIKVPTVEIDPALETIRIALSPQKTTPATDTFLDEVKTEARKEGAYFVANRMLAAWEAGFIDDTAKNAADIARMILTSTEFMANAREGDFDRSFSDGVLEDIAEQLRKGGKQ
ncbi:TPA: hypothetical protein ACWREB_001588 [Escherichia coli]|jgi:hypothetical protein|uniref:hypothetical protein n=1 Tax=Enterobacteriaceae TaxID=543 RepID=UPI0006C48177|nr:MULTISPECIES: hypothetical protein [Enterobacteriaceae]EBB6684121.1 hypothetical protein [Salmonella enterica]ECC9706538.1 hypothetical protein [Salmonella enterica subsp. salamae]ECF7383610.1 hypothetical protein [Salmonella enterica subsp. enterica]ECT2603229.1 hypothetical protein [Salmonella enterica subsp. enterica serovar Montevideo]EFX1561080.1 hypothetical protein [Shigella sonnei]EHQ1797685.1 hypothetical protein [Salmonella enterica subsp. enterica serovar Hartford]EKG8345290.1 